MAPRPISTASISFGLVSVPVKLYATSESSASVSFNLLNQETGHRLKQQYIDSGTGEIVPRKEMAKGYEVAKNQYVVFTPDELKAIEAKSTGTIDIAEFVPSQEVDDIYLDKTYYLGPDKGGDRAYKLLSAALKKTGRVAVAKYAARGKQYLVMIRPKGDGLVLEQLRYADEVKPFEEVPIGEAELKDSELDLAVQLIQQAASEGFDPTKYEDDVRKKVMDMIQAKIEGQDITQAEPEEPKGQIIDLMSALKASLASKGEGKEEGESRKATAAKSASGSKRKKAG
jgi:DNA end-binding protein Ku